MFESVYESFCRRCLEVVICLSVKVDSVMVVKDEGRLRVDGVEDVERVGECSLLKLRSPGLSGHADHPLRAPIGLNNLGHPPLLFVS